VIAASNRNLADEVAAGRFREDLYWRLNVVPIDIPPLRDRREDIPDLVAFFLRHYNQANDRQIQEVDPEALKALQAYHWPGNVRELQNYIERAVVMAESDRLSIDLLPEYLTGSKANPTGDAAWLAGADFEQLVPLVVQRGLKEAPGDAENLHAKVVDRIEKELIAQVLDACQQVQTKTATRLGINRNTLHKKMKDYSLGDSDSP
jgi:DNA-binding NtrC family response regulator